MLTRIHIKFCFHCVSLVTLDASCETAVAVNDSLEWSGTRSAGAVEEGANAG